MNKTNDVARCPQCSRAMPHDDMVGMCTHCGWVSVGEIKRQISYWNQRLLAATKVTEKALLEITESYS